MAASRFERRRSSATLKIKTVSPSFQIAFLWLTLRGRMHSAAGSEPARRRLGSGTAPGHENLPDLDISRPESTGAGEQVIFPHALEARVVLFAQSWPCLLEVVIPCPKSFVIVRPEVVDIFNDKKVLDRLGDLLLARQHAVRENVFVDPWIAISA